MNLLVIKICIIFMWIRINKMRILNQLHLQPFHSTIVYYILYYIDCHVGTIFFFK